MKQQQQQQQQQQQRVSHIPIVVAIVLVHPAALVSVIVAAARIAKLCTHVRAALPLQPAPEVLSQRARLQCHRHPPPLLDTVKWFWIQ
jgi:hypothetical protein